MKDETYAYIQDVTSRKRVAQSARNRRTHNGKGGRVKLPSDYLTRKELNAMNGKVESYRLNDPMKWDEFKKMPDDLKADYIKLIRAKFAVPDTEIADMLGIHRVTFSKYAKMLGCGLGKCAGGRKTFDTEAWLKWTHGVPSQPEETEEEAPAEETVEEPVCDQQVESKVFLLKKAVPCYGSMTFKGKATDALKTMLDVLGDADVNIMIQWEVQDGNS